MKTKKLLPARRPVNFAMLRAILLNEDVIQTEDYRDHLKWLQKRGLVDLGGLTAVGHYQRAAVADYALFREVRQEIENVGSHSWFLLIDNLAKRQKIRRADYVR